MSESRCLTPTEYLALAELATTAVRNGFDVQMIAVGQLLITLPTAMERSNDNAD